MRPPRGRRRYGMVLGIALAFVAVGSPPARADGGGGSETISVTIPATAAKVSCSKGGDALGYQPSLHRDDHLRCVATGFAGHEQVSVTLHSADRAVGSIRSDGSGTATYNFTVPDNLATGTHALTFTGQTSGAVASFSFVVVAGNGGGGGHRGGIAFTGLDVLALLLAALALIIAGSVLAATNRQRRESLRA